MTSEQARELFSAAFDGALEDEQRSAFDAALKADAQLAAEYHGFKALLEATRSDLGHSAAPPNLLPSVQRKLRRRSRGRYYSDRFSERSGRLLGPITLALSMLALLTVVWLAVRYLQAVEIPPQLPVGAERAQE